MEKAEFEKAIEQYMVRHSLQKWNPQGVLFDMDGVLYDSMPRHVIAWKKAMQENGACMTDDDVYATEGARGIDTIRNIIHRQMGKDLSEEEAQRIYDLKTQCYHEMGEAPIMEGALEVMQKIRNAGMKIGIVTGSGQRPLIKKVLVDFQNFVDETRIVTAYDVKHGKPSPEPYLVGLRKVGLLSPESAIVVENAPLGVRAGHAAGMFVIAVNTGPLNDDVLWEAGADIVLSGMKELNDLWENIKIQAL